MHLYLFALALLIFFPLNSQAACSIENQIDGEFLVTGPNELSTNFSTSLSKALTVPESELISSSRHKNQALMKAGQLSKNQTRLYKNTNLDTLKKLFPKSTVQANCKVEFFSNTNTDPMQTYQNWFFQSLGQNYSNGLNPQREIIIAVSDTGTDLNHEDIASNLWTNTVELNGRPGFDDDGNGYVDDIHGYDFGDKDSNPTPTSSDTYIDYDHGTHVAGLIGAEAFNQKGVAGISLNTVKVMALKGFRSNGPSTISDLLKTIYYAVDNGAHIINASWGSEKNPEAAEVAAVNYAVQNGVVIVAAAGNDRVPASWFVPAGLNNVVTVTSVNSSDQLSTFSNYGASVDFVSPGGDGESRRGAEELLSSGLNSNYVELKGTSMAAPLVSGLIGALMSQATDLSAFQAVYILKESGVKMSLSPYLQSNNHEYTKPNFENALVYLNENYGSLPDISPKLDRIEGYSADFSSLSEGGGGCSNSLSQTQISSKSLNSGFDGLKVLFFIMPLLSLMLIKKRL